MSMTDVLRRRRTRPDVLQGELIGLCCNLLDSLIDLVLKLLASAVFGHHAHDHVAGLRRGVQQSPGSNVRETVVDDLPCNSCFSPAA